MIYKYDVISRTCIEIGHQKSALLPDAPFDDISLISFSYFLLADNNCDTMMRQLIGGINSLNRIMKELFTRIKEVADSGRTLKSEYLFKPHENK